MTVAQAFLILAAFWTLLLVGLLAFALCRAAARSDEHHDLHHDLPHESGAPPGPNGSPSPSDPRSGAARHLDLRLDELEFVWPPWVSHHRERRNRP